MALKFEPGSWVWIEDEEERYLPAKVLKGYSAGEPTIVETEDGEERKLNEAESKITTQCNEEALNSKITDLVEISDLNEMSILHVLRIRFKQDAIYTNISAILISVNPFKLLPLYTPEMLDRYRNGPRDLPPHIFGTAYNAFNDMITKGTNQSVVISGESGAGKSEATKLILQFITDYSSRITNGSAADNSDTNNSTNSSSSSSSSSSELEQQILAANPILEAFGNAKTLRNNNSSRFGKLITVNFDKSGCIVGGGIINYLLEKSRVVGQNIGERNYHIFYQLLSTIQTDPKRATSMSLSDPALFDFLNPQGKGVTTVDSINDEKDFEEVSNSFRIMGFSTSDINDISKIVAGVLHYGNVKFNKIDVGGDEGSEINPSSVDSLYTACDIWGVKSDDMNRVLTSKCLKTMGDMVHVAYSTAAAIDARDAMVKKVYSELFQIMVNMINKVLSSETNKSRRENFIGVLDIFGFESFDVNSFEQLCINFCNEKLQFHFNEHIFKMELTLYEAEGIHIASSSFVDNQPTLDMLELPRTGSFSMLDEECVVPRGSDDGFLSKTFKIHLEKNNEHPNMIKPKAKDCIEHMKNFGVLHYAGPVFYNVTGWLEKNRDSLHDDIVQCLRTSSMPMLKNMFPEEAPASSGGGARRGSVASGGKKKTLGGQFKNQLNELIATLNSTFPHFVRCMKSNDLKKGNIFTSSRMQDQLRYAGLVEVCRIRKLGYPVRLLFDEFFKRFKCCALSCNNLDEQLAYLTKEGVLTSTEWAKGKNRVFMRTQQSLELELYREVQITAVAILVQKCARRYVAKLQMRRYKEIIQNILSAINIRTETEIKNALQMCPELPYKGNHIKCIIDIKKLLQRVIEENRIYSMLKDAIESQELNRLQDALSNAERINPPLTEKDSPLIKEANDLIEKIELLNAARAALTSAIHLRDIPTIDAAIKQANDCGFTGAELGQAKILHQRLEQEEAVLKEVDVAVSLNDLISLNISINKAKDLGLSERKQVINAIQVKEELLEQMKKDAALAAELEKQRLEEEAAAKKRQDAIDETITSITNAISSSNREQLQSSLETAANQGIHNDIVKQAQSMLNNLDTLTESKLKIEAALKLLSVKSRSGILSNDLSRLKDALKSGEDFILIAPDLPFPELENASKDLQKYSTQARINQKLIDSILTKDRIVIRKALDEAENLELTIDSMDQAQDVLRDLENEHRSQKVDAGESYYEEEEPYDEAEEARIKRQTIASQPKYAFQWYSGLRTADDYAQGTFTLWGKSTIRLQHLVHQTDKIPKSISMLRANSNKVAKELFQNLLGYMGDKQMPFAPMLAQDVLRKGFENKELRDEIYCQIIKQLSNNPRSESIAKGWQLLCMCVATFPPSYDFEMYLMHFIVERRDTGKGVVVQFAKYCLRTLEAMLSHGEGVGYVPQVEEIKAFAVRPPVLATITLVDGANLVTDLPVTPDTNVLKILEMCVQWTELSDSRVDSLGLFVYDLGTNSDKEQKSQPYDDLERTPRPLRNEDFLGDVFITKAREKRDFKLVFKKKIFLPQENYRGEDSGFDRLLFLQAEDETIIQGNIELPDEKTASYLAAISMAVCYGLDFADNVTDLVNNQACQDFVALGWREHNTPEQWAELILENRPNMLPTETNEEDPDNSYWFADLQYLFVETVQASPMYGMHWFYCHPRISTKKQIPEHIKTLSSNMSCAFNCEGLHLFTDQQECIASYGYADIFRWGGTTGLFNIILADEDDGNFELSLITSQSTGMANIILDHIHAIMSHQEDEPAT